MSENNKNTNIISFYTMIKKVIKSNTHIVEKLKKEINNSDDELIKQRHKAYIEKLTEKINSNKTQLMTLGEQAGMTKVEILKDLETSLSKKEESQLNKILETK